MAKEIERKFLVDTARLGPLLNGVELTQGYASISDTVVVRVRLTGDQAWLTLKGKSEGPQRSEFEYEVPVGDARKMILEFCGGKVISKTRYCRQYADHLWEIDVFEGSNSGLIVAEVELASTEEQPELPPWAGQEVTQDTRYFNSSLYEYPFCDWDGR